MAVPADLGRDRTARDCAGGGSSKGVSPASRTTDPNSHTSVSVGLAVYHRPRHLQYEMMVDPNRSFATYGSDRPFCVAIENVGGN